MAVSLGPTMIAPAIGHGFLGRQFFMSYNFVTGWIRCFRVKEHPTEYSLILRRRKEKAPNVNFMSAEMTVQV
jgi:hypothetical protein